MAPPKYENHSTTNQIVEGATYAHGWCVNQTCD